MGIERKGKSLTGAQYEEKQQDRVEDSNKDYVCITRLGSKSERNIHKFSFRHSNISRSGVLDLRANKHGE